MRATLFLRRCSQRAWMVGLLGLVILLGGPAGPVSADEGVRIVPIDQKVGGLTYGEWSGEWWSWAIGIPAATNPILDETGEFGDIDQGGPVWFLAGNFGGKTTRTVYVPEGKYLFFPLLNSVWWAPDDVEFAAFVVEEYLGLDPNAFTDLELVALVAIFQVTEVTKLQCKINETNVENPLDYFVVSPPFKLHDTDLLDDLEVPISANNMAVSAGYWIMLEPLEPGIHTIRYKGEVSNDVLGDFSLDIKFTVGVVPSGD